MVLKKESDIYEIRSDLESLFRINKYMKVIQIDNDLQTITQGDSNVSTYNCTWIKSIVDMLDNIDSSVLEKTLVVYAIIGLNPKFQNVVNIIHHINPHLTFFFGYLIHAHG